MRVEECQCRSATIMGAKAPRFDVSPTLPYTSPLAFPQALPIDEGVMMAARCSAQAMIAAIDELAVQAQVSTASVNGPKSVVVAGAEAEVLMVMRQLGQEGKRLSVSHAFHSPLMMPMAEEFRAVVTWLSESEALSSPNPSIPVVSTVTGSAASDE